MSRRKLTLVAVVVLPLASALGAPASPRPDPATVLQHVLGTGLAAQVLTVVYVLWIGLVPATLAIALVWTRFSRTGAWFVTAVSMK